MVVIDFFIWHYLQAPQFILQLCFNYLVFISHFFSLGTLLKTLFSPWRRVQLKPRKAGFSLERFFERLTFNLISRTIGFWVRLLLIFAGLISSLIVIGFSLCLFVVWQFLFFLSWPLFLFNRSSSKAVRSEELTGKEKKFVLKRFWLHLQRQKKK